MEPIEEGERTISIFWIEVVATVVVEEFGVENLKGHDAVEESEVGRESRRVNIISPILVAVI